MISADIKTTRQRLGLNQAEFAQLTGVHPITVSKWERNQGAPTPYQAALFEEFRHASKDKEVCQTLRNVLIGAGIALALALLLRHLIPKK